MNKLQTVLLAALVSLFAPAAFAAEVKAAKPASVPASPESTNVVSSVGNLAGGKGGGAASSSYARESADDDTACPPAPAPAPEAAKNTGPDRISTNVTVPKQTQGATFGEKVNQGLHASGGSLAQGASTVGAAVPGGAVISTRCAKLPAPEPMATPESTEK